jgi:uncharacterized repeat protein (TIGR01451 family)
MLKDDDYCLDMVELHRVNGVWTQHWTMDFHELAPLEWHSVELELLGPAYEIWVDGTAVLAGQRKSQDSIHHLVLGDEGGSGGCWGDAYWDDVEVFSLTGTENAIEGLDATCTVSFYMDTQDPTNLISSVENVFVPAEGQTSVSVDWNPVAGEHDIIVAISEANPTDRDVSNNVAGMAIVVAVAGHVDLSISSGDISLSDEEPVAGTLATITANVQGDQSISSDWVKHGIVLDLGGWGEDQQVGGPCVLQLPNGTYAMYYLGKGNDGTTVYYRIFRAFSYDGLEWQKQGMVLNYGGVYAGNSVYHPYVWIAPDGRYHMWYAGQNPESGNRARILHATSPDGFNFVYDKLEINFGSSIEPDSVNTPFVLPVDEGYRMWYTGTAWTPLKNVINSAHKTNLGDAWVKDGTVLSNNGIYDNPSAQRPWILKNDDGYEMFYSGTDASGITRILHATSQDGTVWIKDGMVIEPTLPLENVHTRWCSVLVEDGTYRMWYTGTTTTNNRIFYAEKVPGYNAQDATCTVSFYMDTQDPANLIGSVENVFVPADCETAVSIDWNPVAGDHEIIVVVENVNPTDSNLANNIAAIPVSVSEPEIPAPAELVIEKVKLSGIDDGFTHTYYEWELLITVTNNGGADALDVTVYDILPAELELLENIPSTGTTISSSQSSLSGTRAAPVGPTIQPVRSTHISWAVGTLAPGQAETLYLKVCTRLNPAEKQEFTSPGIYVINEGAYAEGTDSLTGEPIFSERANAITVSVLDLVKEDTNLKPPTVKLPKTWFFMVMVFACFLPGYKRKR